MTNRRFGVNTNHEPRIVETGNGSSMDAQPNRVTPFCSCGWAGITLVERWHDEVNPDFSYFAPDYKAFVERYGVDQMLKENEAYEASNQLKNKAVIQILQHLDYDPSYDKSQALLDFKSATKNFEGNVAENFAAFASAKAMLNRAIRELSDARDRDFIWQEVKMPLPAKLNSEAQEALTALRNK